MSINNLQADEVKAAILKIKTTVDRTFQYFDTNNLWKRCPACFEEWAKLRACPIVKSVSYLCVECAESLKSWDWIVRQYPIARPFENWSKDWISTFSFYREGMQETLKNKWVCTNLWLGKEEGEPAIKWLLFPTDPIGFILHGKQGFIAKYDNSLEAWFDMSLRATEWAHGAQEAQKKIDDSWIPPTFKKSK